MAYLKPAQIAAAMVETGVAKARNNWLNVLVLGFLAGAFIAFGFLADIRVIAGAPKEWGSIATFIGAAVFPVGLMLVVLGGGDLLTGNMMSVPLANMARRIRFGEVVKNIILVTISNFVGALFVAYFFGHVVGLTHDGVYLDKLVSLAHKKIDDSFVQAFFSGIGCNWLVCLAVWLAFSTDNVSGKILGIWFPIMAFVATGFQHIVANMFLIPAAIFEGQATWAQYFTNFVPVFLGNFVGGAVFVAVAYFIVYLRKSNTSVSVPVEAGLRKQA